MDEKIYHGLKLLARCGGGAYGDVYYCEDISGKRLALKVINKKRLGGAWKRELQGVINYRRITEGAPNLLRILHVAEDEETFYYTMEAADSASTGDYLPDTLAQRLQSGPLPPEQLYPVLRGIFNGIKTIHEAGFAHRDIKPDNILFVDGIPKLGDIGLLSSLSSTMTALAGTLEFLPPEVRAADSPESSDRASRQRSDLYAFGKVVYCAATGLEPGNFPTVPTREKLSPELKLFLNLAFKLCAKTPERRIGDEETLARELERIEKTRGKTGKLNLPRSIESVKKFLLTPIPINRHVRDILKWSCRHAVTLILLLSCVTCYWVLNHYYPDLQHVEPPTAPRKTTETIPIHDSGPAKPVEPQPPPKMTEPVKKEIPTIKVPVPVEKKTVPSASTPKPEQAPVPVAEAAKTDEKKTVPSASKPKPEQAPAPVAKAAKTDEKKTVPSASKPKPEQASAPVAKAAKTDEKKTVPSASKPKPEQTPRPVAKADKTVAREPKRTVEKTKTTRTKSPPSSTTLLSWMLRNAPYRKIAEERIAELKKMEELRKAGKYDASDDAGRAMEEKLWQAAAYSYKMNNPSLPYYLRRIEQICETRKAFESAAAASGGNDTPQAVVPELALYIGWFKYRELRNSKRFGKLLAEHEAEITAERELRRSGAAVPEPGSDVILEKKLWENLNKIQSYEQIPYILEHIEYVREHRGQDPKPPEIKAEEVKKLVNQKLKCEMYIPRSWTIATSAGRDPADTSDAGFSPDRLNDTQKKIFEREQYMSKFHSGFIMAYCDEDKEWRDTLTMWEFEGSGGALFRTSGWSIIGNKKRTRFAERCCVIEINSPDATRDPNVKLHDLQVAVYLIDNGNTCLLFSLETKKATFKKRREELEAALRTMKFYL